jgi:hypothetical protein
MKTLDKYREEAKHCRDLLDHPIEPEVRIQLRLWAAELDDMADAIECGTEPRPGRNLRDHRKIGSGP